MDPRLLQFLNTSLQVSDHGLGVVSPTHRMEYEESLETLFGCIFSMRIITKTGAQLFHVCHQIRIIQDRRVTFTVARSCGLKVFEADGELDQRVVRIWNGRSHKIIDIFGEGSRQVEAI